MDKSLWLTFWSYPVGLSLLLIRRRHLWKGESAWHWLSKPDSPASNSSDNEE